MDQYQTQLDHESCVAINDYLDAVENILLEQKTPRSSRMLILGELETHIHSMIATRLEAGATLQLELITSVIETLDAPDSYRKVLDAPVPLDAAPEKGMESPIPIALESTKLDTTSNDTSRKSSKWRLPNYSLPNPLPQLQAYWQRDRLDEFAIASCALNALVIPVLLLSRREEASLVLGGGLLIVASCLGWYSIRRIKRSGGKLWGGRVAFAGSIVLPILLINTIGITLAIRTPLGGVLLAAVVIYANIRLIKRAWRWIECQRMKFHPPIPTEPVVASSVNAPLPAI